MKTTIRFLVGAVALGAAAGGIVCAVTPQPQESGKVLILANHRALEGDIQREGDQYRLKRPVGEMWVPAERVLRLCADWDDAFAFLCAQTNMADPDERLRLARWCQQNGLHEQALAEVKAAQAMRPSHQETKQLLAILERAVQSAQTPAAPSKAAAKSAPAPVASVDVSAETLNQFTTRIQPILMNACVNCHAGNRGGDFKLIRCYDAALNRRSTQTNLAAVLAHVNLDRPEVSPLLVKAASAHGALSQSPLQGRESAPFRTLQYWVQTTVARNPHLKLERDLQTTKTERTERPVSLVTTPTQATPTTVAESTPPVRPATGTPSTPLTQTSPAQAQAVPADEFDPLIFNRQNHPHK
jgi:hypothetical protein